MQVIDLKEARKVRDLANRERYMALSDREWKHRLAGYGYRVSFTERGAVVSSLRHGVTLCTLPAEREFPTIH
ncbi:MAG: hypothetical protein ACLFQL_12940 [Paracoccaceae bacterium]